MAKLAKGNFKILTMFYMTKTTKENLENTVPLS